ncbi:MAG: prolyl oligopeptidase family serine peptidase [Acidobacteria bacterium]|jgi:dipeptidyl aminopeptidase/acylaminoacyl peptidase|nr:prolyl oligopeptidase family serine peptidase [Acidobacteriota bacterium]
MKSKIFVLSVTILFLSSLNLFAQSSYKKPPKDVLDVLNAATFPQTSISPAKDKILLLEPLTYPSIAELSQPMLRLAGLRINPNTNGAHRQSYAVKLALKNIADGKETVINLPANAQIISAQWSADGKYVAAGNITPTGIELWTIETANGKAKMIKNARVNTAFGGFSWMPDQKSLLVNLVPSKRNAAPNYQNLTPTAPNIQETTGKKGTIRTYQDLLRSPNDESLFEYYATSQLAVVSVDGKIKEIGQPAIFDTATISPDGNFIVTSRVQRPFSYLLPASDFPQEVEIWNKDGKSIYKVASVPLQDNIPVDGVTTAPRNYGWIPTESATLVWAEALNGGNPKAKVEFRDKLMKIAAPFSNAPSEIVKTQQRFAGRTFGERDGLMLYSDYNRDTRKRRLFMMDYRSSASAPKMIFDLNVADRYNDIGQPVTKRLPNGFSVIQQNGDEIFLSGAGASTEGDRPFLRRMNLQTLKTEEIWRSGNTEFEGFVVLLDDSGTRFLTRKESPLDPPNLYLRSTAQSQTAQKITTFPDPASQLRGIKKQLVKYKRADGVDLQFTLYTPPNYKEGTRLPTLVWAYPLEFTDASVAGQVSGSTNRFTSIGGISHLFFLLNGYAVLDNATMPVVGDPETVNDTFIKQINDSAKAAIDKAVEMGVTDPERVGVGGHSYGAFMTANLLAHSDLFRAGIARSGAYNRTLTPFGFQGERRNFWEATELYTKISPFFYADKINEPLLLIHGEADNNTGTFPIQSERLFAALQGTGGTARLVMLPYESHGYAGRESVEHTLYEMISWFDKYVKNAKPREKNQTAKQ